MANVRDEIIDQLLGDSKVLSPEEVFGVNHHLLGTTPSPPKETTSSPP